MNLIIFNRDELRSGVASTDPRVVHVREVLGFGEDDWFDIGIENGPRGKARMIVSEEGRATFRFELGVEPPQLHPITLIIGMPRPQTARRLLREMTTIGVSALHFTTTERSEPGYASSRLWTTGEYERHVRLGAEQAFCTRLPSIVRQPSVLQATENLPVDADRIALDNYESDTPLAAIEFDNPGVVLAIGAERGWTGRERDVLRTRGFRLAGLGERVLRVESAAILATGLVLAKLGRL
jgi:RsmE family RNA methyltransferase